MRKLLFSFFILTNSIIIYSQNNFDTYFTSQSLRIDFVLSGNNIEKEAALLELKKEPYYGGPHTNMIDKMNYGEYQFLVFEKETNILIYKRGFCTLFEEWQTTNEANSIRKAFYESISMPYPKVAVRIQLEARKRDGSFEHLLHMNVEPNDYFISPEITKPFKAYKIHDSGEPKDVVDLVFIAEAYTQDEMPKFKADAKRIKDYLFTIKPYSENKDKFNIWIVESYGKDSGPDIPGKGIFKNTILNTTFYTFDIDRYMSTYDFLSVKDVAANAPYDHICILVNSEKYGGGGIYNHFSMGTVDNDLTNEVFVHELGHGLAGLGDEYYSSAVAYNDFFNLEVEPWQPNLTTLVNFENKWKDMLNDDTKIPTEPTKENVNTIGVYEGGGYVSKGVYRPFIDCRMKSNTPDEFCPVCQRAIQDIINFYCGK